MRKQHPKHREKRTQTKFLWLPKRIEYETRWLEVASWEEVYKAFYLPRRGEYFAWKAVEWV